MRTDLVRLFGIWLRIGLQSFGGGAATLYLMRLESVERQQWLTDEEFSRNWGICQIAPGINLLGQTILIGWKVAGAPGVVVSLGGLLLPSVSITMLITAIYARIQDLMLVRAALHGVVPATVGLGLLLGFQMARPILVRSRAESSVSLTFSVSVIAVSALLVGLMHAPVVGTLWGAGILSAIALWWRARRSERERG